MMSSFTILPLCHVPMTIALSSGTVSNLTDLLYSVALASFNQSISGTEQYQW
jgi:hypothetical protein